MPGPVLLHLHRRVEHVERAGRVQPVHQRPEQLRVHVVDLALDRHDPSRARGRGVAPHHQPQHVRMRREIVVAGAVADRARRASRQRAEALARSAVTSSAPVGVTSSVWTPPRVDRHAAAAGAPSPAPAPETRRARIAPCRCRRSAATTRSLSAPSHSMPKTAPTMSTIESTAPTSWRWTRSTGMSWIAASASARRSNSRRARALPGADSADRSM